MKNQYVADIGDYGKYSLLKAFLNDGIKVGINWYLTSDDGSNDGKFTKYLDNDSENSLKGYDPETFEVLRKVKVTDKTIHGIEQSGLLAGCSFYNEKIELSGTKQDRMEKRKKWHMNAVKQLSDASLVFLDPDNGLREKENYRKNANKYVLPDEIRAYYKKQNVVYYCHKGRRSQEEWERYKSIMLKMLPGAKPIVLTYHKGTQRSYFFLIHPKDYRKYRKIIDTFLEKWEKIFTEETILVGEEIR